MNTSNRPLKPFVAFALALLIAACSTSLERTIDAGDSGGTVNLKAGEELIIKLDADHETGFRWTLAGGGAIAVPAGPPSYEVKSSLFRSRGVETWRFRTPQPGKEILRLEYRRQAGPDKSATRSVSYQVVVR